MTFEAGKSEKKNGDLMPGAIDDDLVNEANRMLERINDLVQRVTDLELRVAGLAEQTKDCRTPMHEGDGL